MKLRSIATSNAGKKTPWDSHCIWCETAWNVRFRSGLKILAKLKRQAGIWRLTAVNLNASLPVGDPRILEKSWWGPTLSAVAGTSEETAASSAVVIDERPKMNPLRAVRMIGMAENLYVHMHPGAGYTCNLSNLVNIGKGMDEEGMYNFMDADLPVGFITATDLPHRM